MTFITYGQVINGQMCRCLAMCASNCVCGCPACTGKGITLQYEDNKKPRTNEKIFEDKLKPILESLNLDWTKVTNSSNIFAYAKKEADLYVQFIGGATGKYLSISDEDYNLLIHAESKGKVISNIIRSKYKYEKIV